MGVHGGRHQLGAGGRQRDGGEHVICQTVGQLGQHVGSSRGNEQRVRRVGKRNMRHIILEVAVEGIHDAAPVCQRFKNQRGDELGGVFRHQHMHIRPHFYQRMGHVWHFVGRNAAGDAQHNGFSGQVHSFHLVFHYTDSARPRQCCNLLFPVV